MKKEIIEKLSKRSKDLFLIHPITDSRLEKLAELILDNKDEIHLKKVEFEKNHSSSDAGEKWEKSFLKIVLMCSDATTRDSDIDDFLIEYSLSEVLTQLSYVELKETKRKKITVVVQKECLATARTIFARMQSYESNFSCCPPTNKMRENMSLIGSIFLQVLCENLPTGKSILLENQNGIEKTLTVDKLYYACGCGFLSEFLHFKFLLSKTSENKVEIFYSHDISLLYKQLLNEATGLNITIPEEDLNYIKKSVDLLFQTELVN